MSASNEDKTPSHFRRRIGRLRRAWRFRRRKTAVSIRNRFRKRHGELGYLILPLGGSLPERSDPPRSFIERQLPLPPPALSMQTIQHTCQRIMEADNVPGVVILLQPLSAGLASLQSLRAAMLRLREAGKRVIVYTHYLTIPSYFIGSAADMLVVPPSVEFQVLGLQAESRYFKDALAGVGISTDVVAVSPYKSAGSAFSESTMPDQEREQVNWLLDENFDMLTADMASGRGLTQEQFQELINHAPFGAARALEDGLVDVLAYDDQLAELIAERWPPTVKQKKRKKKAKATQQPKQVKLIKMGDARKRMIERVRPTSEKYIGVISVEGAIMMDAAPPLLPFGSPVSIAAQSTLVPLLRRAAKNEKMAALILHVNSPGGDALASDLIWREVERIRPKKPIIVYMNNVAASGGYYVAAGANTIIAQRGTITGSIGVIITRPTISGVYDKLNINRVTLKRGDNASLYRGTAPWNPDERELVRERLIATYDQFKQVVAQGRDLPFEELDPICEGRVWTGRQAQAHQLVDEHGDFLTAVAQARKLAKLPETHHVPVRNMVSRSTGYVLPDTGKQGQPSLGFHGYVQMLENAFNNTFVNQMNGRPIMMMPFDIRFW